MTESAVATRAVNMIVTGSHRFTCAEGDTLLRAALRAGVAAAYECNSGGCGTCTFQPQVGEYLQVQENPSGLTARDLRKGRQLACQSVPSTDCEVQLTVGDHEVPIAPRVRTGVIVDRREISHDLTELTVQTQERAEFLPGQFAMVGIEDGAAKSALERLRDERAYSMSNLPNDSGQWQFQIKEVPGGALSGRLARKASIGAEVRIDGPYGHAYLKDTGRDVVCIAGGSGLAPMVSVARGLAARADAAERRLDFFYGGRGVRDLCAGEFVTEVGHRLKRISFLEVLSDAAPGTWDGLTGFLHDALPGEELRDLRTRDIYLAGPPVMTDAVVRRLVFDLDVQADQIHFDRFF